MRDALALVAEIEQIDTGLERGLAGGLNKCRAARHTGFIGAPRKGIDNMIHRAERLFRVPDLPVAGFEALQGHAARAFMQKHAVYIYEAGAVAKIGDLMLVPDFLDTGEMPGDAARWLTADFAYRKDRLLVSGEYIRTDLDSPLIADPGFTGSYVWAEWSLTGEVRNYNADKGVFTRPLPAHDFSMGGMGAWSLAFAVNDTDLNEGTIDGGDMQQVSIGINWYPEKSYRWGLEFSRIWLDRMGLESETDVAHLFLHVSNL